ncbi:MFS transporter [Nonomuraea sp. NPDC050310]|uniref:MFS transporter n=1 Tax=unclassified Nonomuraea TaxID=2593643 RepID=UPI0034066ED2
MTDAPRLTDALRVREFRALWLSGLISRLGDQFARVALAVLAYDLTGSAAITTLTYALTLVPNLLGGPLLGGLADRFPRRRLMIVCDLARAALVGLMAVPGVPFPLLCALVFCATLLDSPERTARIATTPDVLGKDLYQTGVTLLGLTSQVMVLAGLGAGGLILAVVPPRAGLLANAASFVLAALLVARSVKDRPAARTGRAVSPGELLIGVRLVLGDARLRSLLGLALLAAFYIAPEGLAVPYNAQLGGGGPQLALLLCAIPAGSVLGMFLVNRLRVGLDALGPLALCSCLPLTVCAFASGAVLPVAAWFLTGLLASYQVLANAEYVRIAPDERRGQVIGVAQSALIAAQGLGVLVSGPLADRFGPAAAVATYGVAGTLVALPLARAWRRSRQGGSEGA